jgi:tRNA-Thr(GGU) m(6)t(6)A37 methyltransferase TsaA
MSRPAVEREQEPHMRTISLVPVGHVESPLKHRDDAPKQGHEGAPEAWIAFEPDMLDALDGIKPGDRLILLTWFDRADRDTLKVHPRSNPDTPLQGVFNTRSPDRPNPIGLHPVEVLEVDGARVRVSELEALDGTPIIDVKPVI